jgi:nucleoside-diphosphate-sugar epimerase
MSTIAIVGASGYIGRHLVAELLRLGGGRIKVLSRSGQRDFDTGGSGGALEIINGDLQQAASLQGFLEADCTVINLVYLWGGGEPDNLRITRNLLDACKAARVGRLIHCSTAAVVGRVPDDRITENIACCPVTEYGITKLKIEQAVIDAARGYYDAAILRPTSVFGPAGDPLKELAGDLTAGSRFRNYLKSCLFGKRRMNLVHVANVVAAILFLVQRTESLDGAVFIVSDDDSPANNFADVERFLMRGLRISDYSLPRLPIPLSVLGFLLARLGRNNVNPRCNYAPDKLLGLGLRRPVSFEAGLAEYASWYRSSYLDKQGGSAG